MASDQPEASAGTANIIYILYLAGVVVGVTPLIGVIMAYVARGDAPDWLQTHYRFQIRTFWIGVGFGILAAVLTVVIIGFPMLLALLVWLIVRCVKGMNALSRREPHPDPDTLLFG